MMIFNGFSPRLTQCFAKNRTYFGESVYDFYARLFLRLPFHWAKWWLEPNDAQSLQMLSVRRQVKYFNKVSPTPETFNALISEACVELLKLLPKERLFAMLSQMRFSGNVLTYLRDWERYDILEEYIKYGALSMAGVEILIEPVSGNSNFQSKRIAFLEKYAMRYKLSEKEMDVIYHYYQLEHYERLQRANLCYEQCRKVRYFCGLVNMQEERAWKRYCQENNFEAEAQAEMTLQQYKIFSNAGCRLKPDAIIALLKKPNEKYWRTIFENEPENGLIRDDIADFVLS
ncbi:MAG: hypothetical protein IJ824_06130, partial [Alphaproteobacteria bacterium]|nr:hypothetical protein [Alphaproteobacteria bacterium]